MRADVLALTPEALAALTNRGLVKRATREAEAAPPAVTEDPDGTLHGVYADGTAPALPTGGLDRATCTCGAVGVCRHVLGLILTYQATAAVAPAAGTGGAEPFADPVVDWSPGEFSDEQLAGRIGSRTLGVARRARRAGYLARVYRPGAADPAARVDLGSATVRFLVPHDLGFVQTDAVAGTRDDVIALAVWAFRVADETAPGEPDVQVDVGEPGAGNRAGATTDGPAEGGDAGARGEAVNGDAGSRGEAVNGDAGSRGEAVSGGAGLRGEAAGGGGGGKRGAAAAEGLAAAVGLADDVLLDGAVHLGAGIGAGVAEVRWRLDKGGLRWPLLAVEELAEQLAAYRERGSDYTPERLAGVVLELHARARAVRGLGGGARARVLGTEEAAETPLRRVRLDGLGCRVVAAGGEAAGDERRIVEVYLAHGDSSTVLVLRRAWAGTETGAQLGRRRLSGASVGALAAGTVVTESAVRSASRAVRLAAGRVAKTTVTPSHGAWDRLPDALLVRDLAALAAELDRLPPRVVRPRVEAELVRVVEIARVHTVTYSPGAQRIEAVVADRHGNVATIIAEHAAAAPGRLDAIAGALANIGSDPDETTGETTGAVTGETTGEVSGVVRRAGGGIVIEPLAFAVRGEVVVPDLAEAVGGALGPRWGDGRDPLRAAVDHAIAVLAEVPHRGLRHLPPGFAQRLRAAGDGLVAVGLYAAAGAVGRFREALGPEPGEPAVASWVDAHLRLTITAELQ